MLVGGQVVGRAFLQAYRQAAANSAAAGTQAGKAAATTGISGSNLLTKQLGIDLDEACKILNVKKEGLVLEEINKVSRVTHHSSPVVLEDPSLLLDPKFLSSEIPCFLLLFYCFYLVIVAMKMLMAALRSSIPTE